MCCSRWTRSHCYPRRTGFSCYSTCRSTTGRNPPRSQSLSTCRSASTRTTPLFDARAVEPVHGLVRLLRDVPLCRGQFPRAPLQRHDKHVRRRLRTHRAVPVLVPPAHPYLAPPRAPLEDHLPCLTGRNAPVPAGGGAVPCRSDLTQKLPQTVGRGVAHGRAGQVAPGPMD